jgi:hypothetical protein
MKKLRLDDLSVESFNTTEIRRDKGTVVGEQMCTCYTVCTCPGCPTCDATCAYTCDDQTCPACPTCAESCNGTCPGQGFTCLESCGGTCWNPRCNDSNICP